MRNFIKTIDATTGYAMLIKTDDICVVEAVDYKGTSVSKISFSNGRQEEYVRDNIDTLSQYLCCNS